MHYPDKPRALPDAQGIFVHGTNGFDAVEFAEYIWGKRIVFLIACAVAIVVTLAVSLLLPKRYTARSSIFIEAPAGNDPRAATAVSSVYLESLKTYESFASSDTVFERATRRFQVDASKNSVLKVTRPVNTTVIEIAVTLHDPRKAQGLAQYIAEQTVEMNRSIEATSADSLIVELRSQSQAALERLTNASRERDAFATANPIEAVENELRDGSDFESRLDQDLAHARTELAGDATQPGPVPETLRRQMASAEARITAIGNQRRDLARLLAQKGSQLDTRKSRLNALEDEERVARNAYEDTRTRLNETLASPLYRGGRLRVIDPGVVPQRPSFPQTPLNLAAALLASLMGTFLYLALRFGYVRLQRERSERLYSHR
jgi:uncharacterized protein involved in exopolysaccharide biosynthesis